MGLEFQARRVPSHELEQVGLQHTGSRIGFHPCYHGLKD